VGLDAGERVDDALVRATDRITRFVKRHFNVMQWLIVAGIAVWIGLQIYNYRKLKGEAKAGDSLGKAAQAALAPLKDEAEAPAPGAPEDTAPKFSSDEERLKAAREAYEAALNLKKNEGSVLLAELGLAGVELDLGKAAEARARYERVKAAPFAQQDAELRGRALEGIALSHEAAGEGDAALKAYRELENAEISGFVEVALLSQARLQIAKGEIAPAKETLDKLTKRLEKNEIKSETTFYLGPSLTALKQQIDPEGANKPLASEEPDMEALKKTLEELSQKAVPQPVAPQGEPAPLAPAPEPVVPVPTAPAPAPKAPAPPKPPAPVAPAPAPAAPAPVPAPVPAPGDAPQGTPPQ